jgi:uncharacterized membrane protein YozB (DUF420 family)
LGVRTDLFLQIATWWAVLAIVAMVAAVVAIRRNNTTLHRRLLLFLVLGGWAFTSFYILGYRGDMALRAHYSESFNLWLRVHGTIAVLTLLGATLLVWARYVGARKGPLFFLRGVFNSNHRVIGRVTALFWLFTHLGGLYNVMIMAQVVFH